MATDVQLCSRALVSIGSSAIASFSDGTMESNVASQLYATTRDNLLGAWSWRFATKRAAITTPTTTPAADWEYAFTLPADCLRVLSVGEYADGSTQQDSGGLDYDVADGVILAGVGKIVLRYVYRIAEAGFRPYFELALVRKLAAEFSLPITESTSKFDALSRLAEMEFRRAIRLDGEQAAGNPVVHTALARRG